MSEDKRDLDDAFDEDELDDDYDYGDVEGVQPSEPGEPLQLLTKAPRDMPEKLGKKVVGWFAGWTIASLVAGGVLLGFGISERSDYRDLLEMKYFGEMVTADVVGAYSEEGEHWADIVYTHKGNSVSSQVDLDDSELSDLQLTGQVSVVFWPEAPSDAATVPWIDSRSPMGEYGFLFIIGLLLAAIGMIIATVGYRRRKGRYENGHEVWGDPITHIVYNDEASTYSTTLAYDFEGKSCQSAVSWKTSKDPVLDSEGRMVGLVTPGKPKKFYVLGADEMEALQAKS